MQTHARYYHLYCHLAPLVEVSLVCMCRGPAKSKVEIFTCSSLLHGEEKLANSFSFARKIALPPLPISGGTREYEEI